MAGNVRLADPTRAAAMNAVADLVDGGGAGRIQIYSGTIPGTPATAPSGTLLAELPLSNPAYTNSTAQGQVSANAITDDADPLAAGTIGWCRVVNGSNAVVYDGAAGISGSGNPFEFSSLTVALNVPVRMTSATLQMPV